MHIDVLAFIVTLNGVYDIACGVAILYAKNTYLANLHPYMFLPGIMNPISLRFMAYWIILYGCIRLFSNDKQLIAASYLIEAIVFLNELSVHESTYDSKALFVVTTSIILAIMCHAFSVV